MDFLKDERKSASLKIACDSINLTQSVIKKTIFIYSAPKVGSTSLVSTFRVFGAHALNVIHVHDERMLEAIVGVKNVSICDLIYYTQKILGHEVYVVDVYRTPIERKMSTFFEKIALFHFNTIPPRMNTYPMIKLIRRFNKLFPHIGEGDWFLDKFNIPVPDMFDADAGYISVSKMGVTFIKLRLADCDKWPTILTTIFGIPIKTVITDYEGQGKIIKDVYSSFKDQYLIPRHFLRTIEQSRDFVYYMSEMERDAYISKWTKKTTSLKTTAFSVSEFIMYMHISAENQISHDAIQPNHYRDEGCICKSCSLKRWKFIKALFHNKFIDIPNTTIKHTK